MTGTSLAAYLYLTLFGSLISYSAYFWLLGHTTPSRLATISYVNPLVAVLLGWALAGESLTLRTALAAAIILLAVGLITSRPAPARLSRLASGAPPCTLRGAAALASNAAFGEDAQDAFAPRADRAARVGRCRSSTGAVATPAIEERMDARGRAGRRACAPRRPAVRSPRRCSSGTAGRWWRSE